MDLSKTQIKHLKKLAHDANPIIWVGQKGLTEAVYLEIEKALDHHELVKIKIKIGDRDDRSEAVSAICENMGAQLVTSIGNTATFFKRNKKEPVLVLPK